MDVICVAIAGMFAERDRLGEATLLGLALVRPYVAFGLVLAVAAIGTRIRLAGAAEEAAFLQGVALELRAGSSLRAALESASQRTRERRLLAPIRLARAGAPMGDIAEGLRSAMPRYGRVAGAAIHTAGLTGGRVADVFEGLAQIAADDRELARERRAAAAQARVSAWIVGGLPIGFLGFGLATGRLGSLLQTGVGIGIVSVGLALLLAGSVAVAVMLRRSLA